MATERNTIRVNRNNPGPFKRIASPFRIVPQRNPSPPKNPIGRPPNPDIELSPGDQLFANLILENMHKNSKERLSNSDCYRVAFQKFNVKQISANVMASNKIRSPKIKKYIQERQKAAAKRVEIDTSRILKGLIRIAEFDPRRLFTKSGEKIPIHKLPDDIALAISSMEFMRVVKELPSGRKKCNYVVKKFKTESRKASFELMGQFLNMWDGQGKQTSPDQFINDIREFADKVSDGVPGGII